MERARPAVLRKVLAFAFLRQADGTRREPNMRQDPVRQKPGLYFSQARQKGYLIDRNVRLLGESGPGRELASHQCTHLGRRGRARIATHALELAFHVGN